MSAYILYRRSGTAVRFTSSIVQNGFGGINLNKDVTMISELEACIRRKQYDEARTLLPLLKTLFHEQREIVQTIDELETLLQSHDPKSGRSLEQLKLLLVG